LKLNKKWIAGMATFAFLLILGIVAVAGSNSGKRVETANDGTAGIATLKRLSAVQEQAAVEARAVAMVSETAEESEAVKEDEIVEEEPQEKEADYWDTHFVVKVKDSLNVRKRASQKSKQVGILFKNGGGKILEAKGNWLKIESGNLKGYVKKSYCLTGKRAERFAKKHGLYRAKALSSGLRVRYKASTESRIYTVVDKGSSLATSAKAAKSEEWVAVNYNGKRAFVASEYVRVSVRYEKGLTMKEYQKKLAEEAAKKKAAEEAARAAGSSRSSSETTTTQQSSVAADVDDVTLLAALIQCEAGTQSYEGMLAVGAVVCNRIRSSRYPNTLRGVIYQRGQFGPARSGILARRLAGSIHSSCRRAAEAALGGADNVGGALHFQSVRSGIQGLVIGGHVFF